MQSLPGTAVELKLIMTGRPARSRWHSRSRTRRGSRSICRYTSSRACVSVAATSTIGPLDTVLTAEANGRTRVVLNLDTMVPTRPAAAATRLSSRWGESDDYSAGSTQFARHVVRSQHADILRRTRRRTANHGRRLPPHA